MSQDFDVGMQGRLFRRSLLLQSGWNYERLQSLGLAFCLEPWLARCWAGQDEAARAARLRHQECFNTQPYMASLVIGMVCALEEEAAAAPAGERRDQLVQRLRILKTASASALAGVGDALFWGALRPMCAGLAIAGVLALRDRPWWAAVWAAGIYLVVHNALALVLRWRFLRLGYEWGDQLAARLKEWRVQRLIRALRWAGLALVLTITAWLLRVTPPQQRLAGAMAVAVALFLRPARISAYRLYAAIVLAGGAASWAGWL
jgi:mannose/fructose/N-acetylgalactosamine-specific phosphotransferase system component IID